MFLFVVLILNLIYIRNSDDGDHIIMHNIVKM